MENGKLMIYLNQTDKTFLKINASMGTYYVCIIQLPIVTNSNNNLGTGSGTDTTIRNKVY